VVVKTSALLWELLSNGFTTTVYVSVCRAVDMTSGGGDVALDDLKAAGCTVPYSA
jgi:hypothetical protein